MISEDPIIDYDDSQKISNLDFVEDQESEPSINHRRKYKGKCRGKFIYSLINYMYLQESEER